MRRKRVGQRGASISPQSGKRSAYTLVEMLLVVAVIGTLAAMTWPSVLRMQADHDLSSAAEQVRLHLASARTKAIKSGVKYQFVYEPKGRNFAVIPWEPEPQDSETTSAGVPTGSSATSAQPIGQKNSSGELSAKLTFVPPNATTTISPPSQTLSAMAFQGMDNAGTLASINWSQPLVFAPDGSAMDAIVTIGDNRGQRIDLTVRGLTGAASAGPMRQEAGR